MHRGRTGICYRAFMRRTSLVIDEEQLTRAQQVLGTTGVKDTIDRALEEILRADLRRRLAERVRTGAGIDRGDEVLTETRRWQR